MVADGIELGLIDASELNNILVAYDERLVAVNNGSHRQLGLLRDTDLANKDQVQWRLERCSDLGRYRYAAPGEGQYNWLLGFIPC